MDTARLDFVKDHMMFGTAWPQPGPPESGGQRDARSGITRGVAPIRITAFSCPAVALRFSKERARPSNRRAQWFWRRYPPQLSPSPLRALRLRLLRSGAAR